MIYLLVAVFSLLAFLILPRTREDSETWDQQRKELAETMDAADKLIEDTKSAERDLQLAKEELEKEGEQSLLTYLTENMQVLKLVFRNIMSMFLRFRDGIILTWV